MSYYEAWICDECGQQLSNGSSVHLHATGWKSARPTRLYSAEEIREKLLSEEVIAAGTDPTQSHLAATERVVRDARRRLPRGDRHEGGIMKAVYLIAVDFGSETTSVVLARASMAIEEEKIVEVEIESPRSSGRFSPELLMHLEEMANQIEHNFQKIVKDK